MNAAELSAAVQLHLQRATAGVENMHVYLSDILSGQPYAQILGPLRNGAGPSGVCVHRGKLIAVWGDPAAVEMSFSVTKTYLSLLAGVAFDRGVISDVDAPVSETVAHHAFAGQRHERIAWRHLLQQTSEWGGALWGVPWWADPQGGQSRNTRLRTPGRVWAYNDVRVNLLALALLHAFEMPLSQVLSEAVMAPIAASDMWEWHGYANSWSVINGRRAQSVSGGAHWGGGLWASALDHARVGLLYLRGGRWQEERVLSKEWVRQSWTACDVRSDYGFLWWRNDQGTVFPQAPRTGRCARGNQGRQLIWIDPSRDLVVVSRWSDGSGHFLADISAAIPMAKQETE